MDEHLGGEVIVFCDVLPEIHWDIPKLPYCVGSSYALFMYL